MSFLLLLLLLSPPMCEVEDGTGQSVCVWDDGTGDPVLNLGPYWVKLNK